MSDLRHMTSQHRLSRYSPPVLSTSIPSSPTSVHSSSSAIFERDIEPSQSPHGHLHHHPITHAPTNPHRIPRSKTTETIEHSVPSVLDSAAAILASMPTEVSIVAPVSPYYHTQPLTASPGALGSGFASPIGSFRSRSPSPSRGNLSNSLLLSIPGPQSPVRPPSISVQSTATTSAPSTHLPLPAPSSQPAAAAHAASATPSSTTTYFSAASDNVEEPEDASSVVSAPAQSEKEAEHEPESPSTLDDSEETTTKHPSSIINPSSSSPPHLPPPQPNANPNRLSFISYADLLSSTPTSTIPLSHLTTAASISEPPPHVHIPNLVQSTFSYPPSPISGPSPTSAAPSLRGFPLALSPPIPVFNPNPNPNLGGGGGVSPIHSTTSSPNRPTSFYNNANNANGNGNGSPKRRIASLNAGLDPATAAAVAATGGGSGSGSGGEWEREGLGSGLVERLAYV